MNFRISKIEIIICSPGSIFSRKSFNKSLQFRCFFFWRAIRAPLLPFILFSALELCIFITLSPFSLFIYLSVPLSVSLSLSLTLSPIFSRSSSLHSARSLMESALWSFQIVTVSFIQRIQNRKWGGRRRGQSEEYEGRGKKKEELECRRGRKKGSKWARQDFFSHTYCQSRGDMVERWIIIKEEKRLAEIMKKTTTEQTQRKKKM